MTECPPERGVHLLEVKNAVFYVPWTMTECPPERGVHLLEVKNAVLYVPWTMTECPPERGVHLWEVLKKYSVYVHVARSTTIHSVHLGGESASRRRPLVAS